MAAGYISDTPVHIYVDGKGRAPLDWWGITPPDGDATPWASAPLGSRYLHKESESAIPVLYYKLNNLQNDSDWGSVSFGRTYSGGPIGLLLALTHN
jgi:hypothetical protein